MGFFSKEKKDGRLLTSRTNTTQSVSVPAEANLVELAPIAHTLTITRLCKRFGTSQQHGLTKNEALRRLGTYGENLLRGDSGVSWYKVLLGQVANALTLVLVAALALSFGVRDWVEGAVIAAVIFLNTAVGFVQEYRAEKTMDSLRQLSSPTALVIRNGESITIPAKDVVPGDVVMITTGDVVPADLRLISVSNLELSEQLLTGESVPVAKTIEVFASSQENLPIGDRINLCYASTVVTKGRGTGVVVGTGMNTQIGRIAAAMSGSAQRRAEQPKRVIRVYDRVMTWLGLRTGTPLQIKLSKLAYLLFGCAGILILIVFAVAKFHVDNEVAIYAIATAIAIIPESLIAVLTLTMAVGTRRMAKQSVIVRKLDALENLGGVTDICSDKTGTLTLGKMSVKKMWVAPDIELETETGSDAIEPVGVVTYVGSGQQVNPSLLDEGIARGVRAASLCNVATIHKNLKGEWKATGDPTEIALQVFATKLGLGKPTLASDSPAEGPDMGEKDEDDDEVGVSVGGRIVEKVRFDEDDISHLPKRFQLLVEFPFSSEVKRMSTIYLDNENDKKAVALIKGAVERVLDASTTHIHEAGADYNPQPLTDAARQFILAKAEKLASEGLRVIAVAQRFIDVNITKDITREETEKDFTFIGLFGIFDPPRPETLGAVRACQRAGIVVHMLTGDHISTARAIAKAVEIISPTSPATSVMTATEFDKLTDSEIDALPELPLVIARCAPETKVRMIHAGKRRGKHMSMSGDGVNDSPALKLAPVGVAMGLAGSDVAKDASDLVLTDDNFDSIRAAVSEGRRLFKNIQRFILHLLTTNVAEVILLIVGLAFKDENNVSVFPLSPLGVLWVNMITSSPPAFGLGLEPAESNLMKMPPHSTKDGAFTWPLIVDTFSYGIAMGATNLLNFVLVVYAAGNNSLGVDCNKSSGEDCGNVFRARSTVFVTLIFQILLYAFELKSFDRSMFSINPGVPFWRDIWANHVMFWAVVAGMVSVVLPVYIPGFNTRVFYQQGISWEWGLVIGMSAVFIVWCELWKFIRRPLYNAAGWWQDEVAVQRPGIAESENGV